MEVVELFLQTDWMPRSGPVTLVQKTTVGLYVLTALLCWLSAWYVNRSKLYARFDVGFWIWLGVIFAVLGFNRSFNVQGAITQFSRGIAYSGYWYGTRRSFQELVVIGVLISGLLLFILVLWLARPIWQRYKLAAFGLAYLLLVIAIRTISFHNTDAILYRQFMRLYTHQILEMSGISIVLVASLVFLKRFATPIRPLES